MSQLDHLARYNLETLQANLYPGRGLIMGRTAAGEMIQVYWLTGRSEGSKNRVLKRDGELVRTEFFDPSKDSDPENKIYVAMAEARGHHIISNGNQTTTVVDHLETEEGPVHDSLETRDYEDDEPIYTPRITGIIRPFAVRRGRHNNGLFWIARRNESSEATEHDVFYRQLGQKSLGECIHTYETDGDPPPSFRGEPLIVPIGEGAEDTALMYWDHLIPDKKVAVAAKTINPKTGEVNFSIINLHEQAVPDN